MADYNKVSQLVKIECKTCNLRNKVKNNTRCIDCIFVLNGDAVTGSKFKNNLDINLNIPKSWIFYYLYYPEL